METKQEKSSISPAPFLIKTYEMVDNHLTDHIVSWSYTGCSFVVWDPPEFSQDLLPKYFKHNNFSSFVRQLNTYGFRKVDPDQWEFANPEFMKGHRYLLSNIHRRKPIHSHSSQGNTSTLTETERHELEREIRRLEREKTSLQLELQRQEKERQQFELESSSLGLRLHGMENRQMQLISFLGQLIQKPGFTYFLKQLCLDPHGHNKKRRLLEADQFLGELEKEKSPPGLVPSSNFELVEKLESSLTLWESFLHEAREIFHKESGNFEAPSKRFTTTREASASSADAESCSSQSMDNIPSSPELVECFREIPQLPASNQADETDGGSSFFRVDYNSIGHIDQSSEAKASDGKSSNELIGVNVGVNDHFWQHFLTEAPGSDARTAC